MTDKPPSQKSIRARVEDDPDLARDHLGRVLQAHGVWWILVLREAEAWTFLLPWPLHHLQLLFGRRPRSENVPSDRWYRFYSSGWLTLGGLIWCYMHWVMGVRLDHFASVYAGDISKTLFSGAFLLGTILSVSVSLPGQTVMKAVLAKRPHFAVHFVVVFLWAFIWGVLGAVLMLAFKGLPHVLPSHPQVGRTLQVMATGIALYGALMELNALMHTVRMYLIGLILYSKEQADAQAKKGDDRS